MTTIRELCSGYGGLSLAVEQVAGGTVVDHAELDVHAAKVHDTHWPDMVNLGDITTVDWAALEPTDIICAGWPCQPISQAGKRKVKADARWLWPHIADAVRVLRPRLVILENVPPLLRLWRDTDGWWNPAPVEEVAGDLAGFGYVGSWRSLRASDVGAPHQRERVFVVAADTVCPGTGRDRRAVPRTPEGARRSGVDVHTAVDGRATAADTDGSGLEGHGRLHTPPREGEADPHDRRLDPTDDAVAADTAGRRRTGGTEPDERPVGPRLEAPRRDDPGRLDSTAWGAYGPAIARWERLTRPAPAPTDPEGRLNPAFSEWMMGLPDGWVTDVGISRTAQLKILGNGVVPQQAAHAIDSLLQRMEVA